VIAYVAMLRAINVGGRKLLMSDLTAIGEELGLGSPRTFIASRNLLFTSLKSEAVLRDLLEERLQRHMSAGLHVLIRSAAEMAETVAANPFKKMPGNKVAAIFLDRAPPADALKQAKNATDERMALGKREIYVAYPSGMGQSKLKIPAAAAGTARNMNSVSKMAQLAREME
jgi:uncharacterized protein (DUF1697 family)